MKVVFFDTESTDLNALMGRVLCASFVTLGDMQPLTFRVDKRPWRDQDRFSDRRLVTAIRDHLETYNLVVSWNGKLHDIPLLNARLVKWGERPVQLQFHVDLMYYAGGASAKVGSRKLDNVAKFLQLPDQKTPLDWGVWERAAAGDHEAMDHVVKHCEQDVLVLREAYERLLPLLRAITR